MPEAEWQIWPVDKGKVAITENGPFKLCVPNANYFTWSNLQMARNSIIQPRCVTTFPLILLCKTENSSKFCADEHFVLTRINQTTIDNSATIISNIFWKIRVQHECWTVLQKSKEITSSQLSWLGGENVVSLTSFTHKHITTSIFREICSQRANELCLNIFARGVIGRR